LFRDTAGEEHASAQSSQATSRVIVTVFTEFGVEQLVGNRVAFINVTREFLVGQLPVPFDIGRAVLEVVQTVDVDDAVVEGVKRLVDDGFTIALDNFRLGPQARLLDVASYVKVDMLGTSDEQLAAILEGCRDYPHIQLIAARLETEEALLRALESDFKLFQGYVFGRPHVLSTTSISPGRLQRLRIIGALSAPEIDFDEVVGLIEPDPAIVYRLLQACNSAASGLTSRVSNVRDAAVLLGLDKVRQWVTLMLLSDLAEATEDQLSVILTRARACQNAAEERGLPGGDAYTVGLLSGVSDLLSQSPAEIATQLPLTEEVGTALADGAGALGSVLSSVRAYELGSLEITADPSVRGMVATYVEAMSWSTALLQQTGAARSARPGR